MMHGTATHGFWSMNGFGSLTSLIILILAGIGLYYIVQKTTETKQENE